METRMTRAHHADHRPRITSRESRAARGWAARRAMPLGCMTMVLIWSGIVQAQPSTADPEAAVRLAFREANERYRDGQFDPAVHGYLDALGRGYESGALCYNLGNALLKLGRTGEALWAYLRAERLIPRDADLRTNLEYARSLLPRAAEVSVESPRIIRWATLGGRWTTRELLAAWLLWWWAACGCWGLRGWWEGPRPLVTPLAWASSLAAAVLLVAVGTQHVAVDRVATAVAVGDGMPVRFAPQETGTTYFTVPEGAVLRVLQRRDGWMQIRRADGRTGWMAEQALKTL